MLFALILFNLVSLFGVEAGRQKRYLVYPDGGPARAQFILGLGIPVDLKEASVTVGTVIKFQYDLPTNSSEYTSRIYGFAETVARSGDAEDKDSTKDDSNDISNEIDSYDSTLSGDDETVSDDPENENNTLIDLKFDESRRKRSLVYAEGGLVADVTTEIGLSLDEEIKRQEITDRNAVEEEEPQRMNRWDFYKIIERMVERYGYSGRPCLLRTICEAAEVPFTHENGLLGEIGHILFTPSTTSDSLSHHTDNEYHAAERLGREVGINCEDLFPECEESVLSTFTHIGEETLHSFGFI